MYGLGFYGPRLTVSMKVNASCVKKKQMIGTKTNTILTLKKL